jgi:ring-1,2-phenylacetyl-CoA epoxidase subunit PaaD
VVTSTAQRAWELLEQVPDPEIPVVSIRELGILREVNEKADGEVEVVITPTYSGCPAMDQIAHDVRALLDAHSIRARIVTRLAPAWSTDWITAEARDKLRGYGIAPPNTSAAQNVVQLTRRKPVADPVPCPHCGSSNTTETSHFGSTACKSLHKCLDCLEPFDHFKPY